MVQAKGTRREVQRFSKAREGSVKYSTRWPWRMDSPCAASLAMPTSGADLLSSVWRREGCINGCRRFAFCSPKNRVSLEGLGVKATRSGGKSSFRIGVVRQVRVEGRFSAAQAL